MGHLRYLVVCVVVIISTSSFVSMFRPGFVLPVIDLRGLIRCELSTPTLAACDLVV